LVQEMMESDLKLFKKEEFLKKGGFETLNMFE
jgi:GDPmannose 4,6-dehydratase